MSQTIDERVVEMRFDNKQFESGVKESLNTLDKLKASLNMENTAKSFEVLDKAANSVSLDGIAAGIEALQNRFSTFGIAGMRIIENVTDSLMSTVSRAVSYIDDAIVSGGLKRAQNIENAHFQLQALLKDEEAVQAVMANAMTSVDGTAYAYDEAAKAASQFAASGMRAGDEMLSALKAVTGVAAMTNSEYEGISRIFTTVAGNGRLMGDQLLQLSSRGLNAAATIADYFRQVQGLTETTESDIREMVSDGQISFQIFASAMDWAFGESAFRANETFTGALSNMRSALARIGAEFFSPLIEQNSDLILLINTVRERINDIKKGLTFDEQRSAISGLAKVTGLTTESLEEMFKTVDENGAVSSKTLSELTRNGADAYKALTSYINGVVDGTVRAGYATTTALNELTKGTRVSQAEVANFVREGKINLDVFRSAMETTYGDQTALSKQFSTSVLNSAKAVSEYLKSMDLSKPLSVVYYGVESVKNVFKALWSVLKPVGKAFASVFLGFSIDDVVNLASKIETLTSKMTLSEEASNNLHDAFKGIFSVIKLFADAILGLIGIVVPVTKPVGSLTDVILGLAGAMGRGLTAFTEWINKSPTLNKVYTAIADNVRKAMSEIAGFISRMDDIANYIYNLPIVQKILNSILNALKRFYTSGKEYLTVLIEKIKDFGGTVSSMIPPKVKEMLDSFIEGVKSLGENLNDLSLPKVTEGFHGFTEKLQGLLSVFKGNEGLNVFLYNLKEYLHGLSEAFTFDNMVKNIETFKSVVGGFINWFGEHISPMFEDLSFGGLATTAGGLGVIYAAIQMFKSFGKVADVATTFVSLLGSVKTTLTALQKDLKADAILRFSKAIALLAVAITVLSFADMDRAWNATIMLGLIGLAMAAATKYMTSAGESLRSLTKALQWKAIGGAIKDIGIAIGLIVATIAALAYFYSKDADGNIDKAINLVTIISMSMLGIIALMSVVGTKMNEGMKGFAASAVGVLALSASLLIIISALKKIFALDIPTDWEKRMLILGGLFLGLSGLTLIVALASKIASKQGFFTQAKGSTTLATSKSGSVAGSILGVVAALYLTVMALEKLFKMDLPSNYSEKFTLLAVIMGGLIVTILAVGLASKSAGKTSKSFLALLSMILVVASIVGAIAILSFFPGEKIFKGVLALGVALIALAVSLKAASKITTGENWKSLIAMVALIGTVVVALGVLSMINGSYLLKAAIALGGILTVLAVDFIAISKMNKNVTWEKILSMVVIIGTIAASLYVLSDQPWDSIAAAGAALSIVLVSIAESFKIMSKTKVNEAAIVGFLFGTLGAIMAAAALAMIAKYDWKNMIAAAASISAVLLSTAEAFKIMSSAKPDLSTLGGFIAGLVAIAVIGGVLYAVASRDWDKLLAAAASISMVLLGLSVAMAICSIVGANVGFAAVGIIALDAFIADLALVMAALGAVNKSFGDLMSSGGELLMDLGNYLGGFIGNIISGIGQGIGDSLANIGTGLSDFVNNASDFFSVMEEIGNKPAILNGAKNLAEAILVFAIADFIEGIATLLGVFASTNQAGFSTGFQQLGSAVKAFSDEVKGIDGESVESAAYCAQVLAETYNNLPKEDGWAQMILGQTKSLSDFASELIPFGRKLVEYSSIVTGNIDKGAIQASINAAQILLTFNEKLGTVGGLYEAIFGHTKRLSEFAQEFVYFGDKIVEYCEIVTASPGVDSDAIQASVDAAEILRVFNDKLPDTGGLYSLLFGHQKTLAEFAKEFIPFGENIVEYCRVVDGKVDKSAVDESVAAVESLATLSNSLTGTSGFLSWFSRETDLSDFGKQLKALGTGLADYSASLQDVSLNKVSAAAEQVEKLVSLANTTKGLDTSGMVGFSDALRTMGDNGIKKFLDGLTGSIPEVQRIVDMVVTKAKDQLITSGELLTYTSRLIGETTGAYLRLGISSKEEYIISTVRILCQNIIQTMGDSLPVITFQSFGERIVTSVNDPIETGTPMVVVSGENLATSLVGTIENAIYVGSENVSTAGEHLADSLITTMSDGVTSGTETVTTSGRDLADSLINAMNDSVTSGTESVSTSGRNLADSLVASVQNNLPYSSFYSIGENAASGLSSGIDSKVSSIASSAISAASAAVESAKKFLQIESPSKVFMEIGEYISVGMANGILNEVDTIGDASEKAAGESIDVMNDLIKAMVSVIDANPEFEPVVRPVMDLSYVERGFNEISEMFSNRLFLSIYDKAAAASSSFSGRFNPRLSLDGNNTNGTENTPTYQFTQNNYSPVALSRVEIYRQTKNLFSTLKGAVE